MESFCFIEISSGVWIENGRVVLCLYYSDVSRLTNSCNIVQWPELSITCRRTLLIRFPKWFHLMASCRYLARYLDIKFICASAIMVSCLVSKFQCWIHVPSSVTKKKEMSVFCLKVPNFHCNFQSLSLLIWSQYSGHATDTVCIHLKLLMNNVKTCSDRNCQFMSWLEILLHCFSVITAPIVSQVPSYKLQKGTQMWVISCLLWSFILKYIGKDAWILGKQFLLNL